MLTNTKATCQLPSCLANIRPYLTELQSECKPSSEKDSEAARTIYEFELLLAVCTTNEHNELCLIDYQAELAATALDKNVDFDHELPHSVLPEEYFCTPCGSAILRADQVGAGYEKDMGTESGFSEYVDKFMDYVDANCSEVLQQTTFAELEVTDGASVIHGSLGILLTLALVLIM